MNIKEYDKQQLTAEINSKICLDFGQDKGFQEYISFLLMNYAYRYFDSENETEIKLIKENGFYFAKYSETKWSKILKLSNSDILPILKQAAKKNPKGVGTKVVYSIFIQDCEISEKQGEIDFGISWNWNNPSFDSNSENEFVKMHNFEYSDRVYFRNKFPKALDDLCSQFV
ncbi:MAG: hypothetical protein H6622_15940 [Halobacteriovoraceae bacterium]|nr:hypothetical protein [Halobacteriovoraceae bacterium]